MQGATALQSQGQIRLNMNLSIPALFPGDIIATSANAITSEMIRWSTNGVFSHALIYLGKGWAIDAMPGKGVTRGPLIDGLREANVAKVFRHLTAQPDECQQAADWAALQIGTPYDNTGAARVGLEPGARTRLVRYLKAGRMVVLADEAHAKLSLAGHDASFFCSELIVRAYEVAGIPILDSPAHLTGPGKFLHARKLALMGSLQEVG